RPAVVVVVEEDDASGHGRVRARQAGCLRDVLERAVSTVTVQGGVRGAGEEDVLPAVAVDGGDGAAGRARQCADAAKPWRPLVGVHMVDARRRRREGERALAAGDRLARRNLLPRDPPAPVLLPDMDALPLIQLAPGAVRTRATHQDADQGGIAI